jgi:predicted kinase
MESPLLVVIQGAPGSGKTTLVRRLERDINLPILGKDDVKELLFDRLPQADKDFSRLQGMASFEMLYAFARTFLGNGKSIVIEGAFHTELSRQNIGAIMEATGARYLEVFCHMDEDVRQQRFVERAQDGTRHSAHLDGQGTPLTPRDNYLSLQLGECIDADTTVSLSDDKYAEIVKRIQELSL